MFHVQCVISFPLRVKYDKTTDGGKFEAKCNFQEFHMSTLNVFRHFCATIAQNYSSVNIAAILSVSGVT